MTFTLRMITLLRDKGVVDQSMMVLDGGSGEEIGRVEMSIKLDVVGILQVVDEDVRKAERDYFDPFVEDKEEIKKQLRKVEGMCEEKHEELQEVVRKVEAIRTAEKTIEIELAKLRGQRDKLKVGSVL